MSDSGWPNSPSPEQPSPWGSPAGSPWQPDPPAGQGQPYAPWPQSPGAVPPPGTPSPWQPGPEAQPGTPPPWQQPEAQPGPVPPPGTPPPWSPEGAPPPGPPGGNSTGLIIGVVVLVVVVAAGVGIFFLTRSGGHDSPQAEPSRPGTTATSSSATPAAPPSYSTLPDPCTSVGSALPSDVRSVKPRSYEDHCTWEQLRKDRSRSLEVELKLEKSDAAPGVGGSLYSEAAKDFSDDLAYDGNTEDNGGFEKNPQRFNGLGDEAFAAQAYDLISAGPSEATAITYDMGGAHVEARKYNAVISVKWRGGDYPPSVRGQKKLKGSEIQYAKAKEEAIAVVKAIMSKLR